MGRIVRRRWSLLVLMLFLSVSALFFGLPVIPHLSTRYVGFGNDATSHMWFLAWWPHAIAHGMNPFLTHAVWAPSGYNLAGTTALPGPSLILFPNTETIGPVAAYNILALAAPALSAWTGYLLCRQLTGREGPSLVAGYLFGFSSYELGQLMGHPNLALAFQVPLGVAVVLRRLAGQMSPPAFVLRMAALVVGQFLISTEVVFTATVFGVLVLAAAMALVGPATRRALAATGGLMAGAYALAAIPLAPYLYYVVKGLGQAPIYDFYPTFYSTDMLNFVLPTQMMRIGSGSFAAVTGKFSGNISEQAGYLGAPLIAAVLIFVVSRWRTAAARILLAAMAIVLVASLGPRLHIAGIGTIALPWRAVVNLPLFRYALPGRFMLYASLAASVTVALWLAAPGAPGRVTARWMLIALAVVSLLPNLSIPFWKADVDTPAFFRDGLYARYLPHVANVLVVPFASNGSSMLWQAQTGFYFRMPEGYVAVVPPEPFRRFGILNTLYNAEVGPDARGELDRFLAAKGVSAVVVADGTPGPWPDLFAHLDPAPVHAGGVTLYRLGRPGTP